jgi:hypothetical protein
MFWGCGSGSSTRAHRKIKGRQDRRKERIGKYGESEEHLGILP